MNPVLDDGDVRLYLGDCREVMAAMPPESVDAIVSDPPYGLEFMGKEWDRLISRRDTAAAAQPGNRGQTASPFISARVSYLAGKEAQEWHHTWATEALRVLKPGGHLLAFGGTRTFHRLTCAIEDAGFEVRDCLSWLYGSGFPKSLDVSKAIDKAAGATREVVGSKLGQPGYSLAEGVAGGVAMEGNIDGSLRDAGAECAITAPATPEAAAWAGWGTALKPAWEPIVVARKPFPGTVAGNVLHHGTGALNIDDCRIGHSSAADLAQSLAKNPGRDDVVTSGVYGSGRPQQSVNTAGRWPANVVLDEEAAAALDAAVGERPGMPFAPNRKGVSPKGYGIGVAPDPDAQGYGDAGGASRFFYTAKASTAERDGATHPTVKPLALMRWLVRLVTPPGGVCLDPFAGSGTTLLAARAEGFHAIGIEREEEYTAMCAHRLRQLTLLGGAT